MFAVMVANQFNKGGWLAKARGGTTEVSVFQGYVELIGPTNETLGVT
jgi:hypothetical protein